MFDNLVNPALDGIKGYINYDSSILVLPSIIVALAVVLLIGGFLSIILKAILPTKSEQYRKLLVDMYVVGMIKKFALEDKIDLIKELSEYNRIEKKSKLSMKGLDSVIENELKEKIAKVEEEKIK